MCERYDKKDFESEQSCDSCDEDASVDSADRNNFTRSQKLRFLVEVSLQNKNNQNENNRRELVDKEKKISMLANRARRGELSATDVQTINRLLCDSVENEFANQKEELLRSMDCDSMRLVIETIGLSNLVERQKFYLLGLIYHRAEKLSLNDLVQWHTIGSLMKYKTFLELARAPTIKLSYQFVLLLISKMPKKWFLPKEFSEDEIADTFIELSKLVSCFDKECNRCSSHFSLRDAVFSINDFSNSLSQKTQTNVFKKCVEKIGCQLPEQIKQEFEDKLKRLQKLNKRGLCGNANQIVPLKRNRC